MNKTVMGLLAILATLAINIGTLPLAFFSLFGTAEGTSIFTMDYLIFALILILANIITLQLFIALIKNRKRLFSYGLILAILEIVLFVLLYNTDLGYSFFYIGSAIIVLIALVLIIKSTVSTKRKA